MPPHRWEPGESGNPAGRAPALKVGAVPEKHDDGLADSLVLLSRTVETAEAPLPMRVAAATALARYQHLPPARFLTNELDLPQSGTIAQATNNIATISWLVRRKKLSIEEGDALIAQERAFIEAKFADGLEQDLMVALARLEQANVSTGVIVSGGLPPLPLGPDDGELIMPKLIAPPESPEPGDK